MSDPAGENPLTPPRTTNSAGSQGDGQVSSPPVGTPPAGTPPAGTPPTTANTHMDPFTRMLQQSYKSSTLVVKDGNGDTPPVASPQTGGAGQDTPPRTTDDAMMSPSSVLKKKPAAANAHNRQVSWGVFTPTTAGIPKAEPLPSFGNGNAVANQAANAAAAAAGENPNKQNVDLDDVLGVTPELQAETYILRAVEKYSNHTKTSTEISDLYSNIMEDEITAGMLNNDEDDTDDEEGDDEFEPTPRNSNTPSTTSTERPGLPARAPSQSTVNSQRSRFKGLVKTHMRNKTVEGTLFGLANALTQLDEHDHGGDISGDESYEEDECRVDTKMTNFAAADKLLATINDTKDNNNDDEDIESGRPGSSTNSAPGKKRKKKRKPKSRTSRAVQNATTGVREEWELFNNYMTSGKDKAKSAIRKIMMGVLLPSIGIAAFLFYAVENPELCGSSSDLNSKNNGTSPPTLPPTLAPTMQPSFSPSYAPTVAPTIGADPWSIGWVDEPLANGTAGNGTLLPGNGTMVPILTDEFGFITNGTNLINGTNVTVIFVEKTEAPTLAPTMKPTKENVNELITDLKTCPGLGASLSWWFLFVGVRHVVVFMMANLTQSLIVDYLALSSRFLLKGVGPYITLFLVQSKGWPFLAIFWALYSLVVNAGDVPYAHHWGYWQDYIDLFNEQNPSGEVVDNLWYIRILWITVIVGSIVAVKRVIVGLMLGRQTFVHYGDQLASVMKNMVLLGEVATLAREIEHTKEEYMVIDDATSVAQGSVNSSNAWKSSNSQSWNVKNITALVNKQVEDEEAAKANEAVPLAPSAADAANSFVAKRQTPAVKGPSQNVLNTSVESQKSFDSATARTDPEFTASEQKAMEDLLDAWEDPQTAEEKEEKKITIGAVLQFRQALTFMKKKYPFLPAFGAADTRGNCIESAQKVYDRLLLRTPYRDNLPFETLAILAKNENGGIDQEKAKELIRAFRPDRDGSLGKLEFVKSIDVIYKELRLLSANISNSGQMDGAVENLINVFFYIFLGAGVIYMLGLNPVGMFISFSSTILAFAFMFGRSAAKYFDGVLFILAQRPYGVGDRMHLSVPSNETSADGSSGWIVEKITLFTTHVYWGATNERATLCNGAISNLRVINAARSPNGTVYIPLKFAIKTPHEKIEIFKAAVEQFMKDRPREWLAFLGFRPSKIMVEEGYIGYTVIAQHRNSWQAVGGITESKANLTTYCLEVAKQLQMRYSRPPLPVDLTMKDEDPLSLPMLGGGGSGEDNADGGASIASSPKATRDALAALSGLRQRKGMTAGRSKFADLVKKVMETNKDQ